MTAGTSLQGCVLELEADARRLEVEVSLGLGSLRSAEHELASTAGSLASASAEAGRAGAAEQRLARSLEEVCAEQTELALQVSWLGTAAADAADAARPLLAARDDVPAHSVDEAIREESGRWDSGAHELRETVLGLSGCLTELASELHAQLVASPTAGDAAGPAAELHREITCQIEAACAALPTAAAGGSMLHRVRLTLLEAARAQSQLAAQSVAHVVSCAADAEAVAALKARQARAEHAEALAARTTQSRTELAIMTREVQGAEARGFTSGSTAWTHAGGLVVLGRELGACEEEAAELRARAALAEGRLAELAPRLEASVEAEAAALSETSSLAERLGLAEAASAVLHEEVQTLGLRGKVQCDELHGAVADAEASSHAGATALAAALADVAQARSFGRLDAALLKEELRAIEAEQARHAGHAAAASAAAEASESDRAEARAAATGSATEAARGAAELHEAMTELDELAARCAGVEEELARVAEAARAADDRADAGEAAAAAAVSDAASREAALATSLDELDASLTVARAATALSRAQTACLAGELAMEEGARGAAVAELLELREEQARHRAEEEARRAERAAAKKAAMQRHHRELARELRTLQLGMAGGGVPRITLAEHELLHRPPSPSPTSSEAMWAGLLANGGAGEGIASSAGAERCSISYASSVCSDLQEPPLMQGRGAARAVDPRLASLGVAGGGALLLPTAAEAGTPMLTPQTRARRV